MGDEWRILTCEDCDGVCEAVFLGAEKIGLRCPQCGKTQETSFPIKTENITPAWFEAHTIHELADGYAAGVFEAGERYLGAPHPSPTAGSALHNLTCESLILHRALQSLCDKGWAATSSLLMRTQLEVLIASGVIWRAGDGRDLMAFRYMYAHMKGALRDPETPEAARQELKTLIEEGVKRLPKEVQQAGHNWIFNETTRQYWYQPDYQRPTDAIKETMRPDLAAVYKVLSGPIHAGFAGLRLFRDDPDIVLPIPRPDLRSESRALAICSVMTVDQAHVKALLDRTEDEPEYSRLRNVIITVAQRTAPPDSEASLHR